MDKIGAIEAGTVEQLVLWAKDDRFRGSIEVRGAHAASVYFSAGFIAHIDNGESDEPSSSDTKERVHARLAQRLAGLLAFDHGSYVIQPSDQLPPEARWLFGPQGLLDTARTAVTTPESRWNEAVVTLDDSSIGPMVEMGEDAFRVVVALARSMRGRAVQNELGWPSERLDRAIDELARRGLIAAATPRVVTPPTPSSADIDLRRDRRPAPPAPSAPSAPASRPSTAPTGPLAGAPRPDRPAPARATASTPVTANGASEVTAASGAGSRTRASALRRLIQNLR